MEQAEYEKKLGQLSEELKGIIIDAPIVQSQDLLGKILTRVFNNGKDSNGNPIGQYAGADSKSKGRYKAKRNAAGRRIDTVDLQFTGSLEESIKNGIVEDGAVIGFNNEKEAKIGRYNEERYGKDIFEPSESEQTDTKELMVNYVREQLQIKVQNIFGNG